MTFTTFLFNILTVLKIRKDVGEVVKAHFKFRFHQGVISYILLYICLEFGISITLYNID